MNNHYLKDKAGAMLWAILEDSAITEVTLNPDGQLWVQHAIDGNVPVGEMDEAAADAFIHAVATYANKFLNTQTPYLDAVLPFHGERINIVVPPIVARPIFTIRKKAQQIYTLTDYLKANIITLTQLQLLKQALHDRKNIIVSGGPASGKTTFTNALLHALSDIAPRGQRLLLLQQEDELQCAMANTKAFYTSEHVSMAQLLWLAMRNSPERIIVGEVRDGSAFTLLKAWNTGCLGGIATLHANHADAVLQRLLDLSGEATAIPPYTLVSEAIDLIVHITANNKHPVKRLLTDIVAVNGFNRQTKTFLVNKLDK